MSVGILLYGPPAAGKDTVTSALTALDPRYQLFPRLKVGPGRTAGYRMASGADLDALRVAGGVIWENQRYGSVYVIDRPELGDRLTRHVPVLHLGQVEAVDAVRAAPVDARWVTVSLSCPRDVAERRIIARATGDTEARLRAWDETAPFLGADLSINTADTLPDAAARTIHQAVADLVTADQH
mgnify:CR=1 FL=1